MSEMRQHRLTLALLFSLLLHFASFSAADWYVPTLADLLPQYGSDSLRFDARLVAPAKPSSPEITLPPASIRQVRARPVSPRRMPRRAQNLSALPGVLALPPVVADEDGVMDDQNDEFARMAEEGRSLAADESFAMSPRLKEPVPSPDAVAALAQEEVRLPAMPVSQIQLPRRGHVRFSVMRGEQGFVVGQSVHHWSHDGRSYLLNSVTETTGLIALFRSARVVWSSKGEIGRDGLRPHEFRTERNGLRADEARFDWQPMKLGLSGGGMREVPLQLGTQDVLSMFYQLGSFLPAWSSDAGAGKPSSYSLYVTTGRKLERYRFEFLGDEVVTIRQRGRQRTLHLRTLVGDQAIELWLAYELRGLPLRIRYTDGKGDSYDQIADEIEFEDTSASSPGPEGK